MISVNNQIKSTNIKFITIIVLLISSITLNAVVAYKLHEAEIQVEKQVEKIIEEYREIKDTYQSLRDTVKKPLSLLNRLTGETND